MNDLMLYLSSLRLYNIMNANFSTQTMESLVFIQIVFKIEVDCSCVLKMHTCTNTYAK